MGLSVVPTRKTIVLLLAGAGGALLALLLGVAAGLVGSAAALWFLVLVIMMAADAVISRLGWRSSSIRLTLQLPAAFAIGAPCSVALILDGTGCRTWHYRVFGGWDFAFESVGSPLEMD